MFSRSPCDAFTKNNIYLFYLACNVLLWYDELKPKIFLTYLETLYFWNFTKNLELCLTKLWGVKSVLYTSVRHWTWIQVQPIKNWASKTEIRIGIQHLDKSAQVSEFSFESNFGGIIKMKFLYKLAPIFVSLFSTSCVLSSGVLGWNVC
jgi:hypothetical protein